MHKERALHRSIVNRRPLQRVLFLSILLGVVVLVGGCGQVMTPEPSPTPAATEASTPSPSRSAIHAPTAGSVDALPDTVTPSVTPTPVVHVVQKGDTLQAIAFDFGVSVGALQRVNGIENPQFLQVGEKLVIPREEESGDAATGLLLPTPTPHPIRVQGVAFYASPVDSLLALGEVVNTTAVTLTNVLVEVTLLDAGGASLAEADTFASMDIVPPGRCSPFDILFNTPPSGWTSYQVTVIRAQDVGGLAAAYTPITVVSAEGRMSGPQFEVSGVVRNASTTVGAKYVEISTTTYDAEGAVTGFRHTSLAPPGDEDELRPGTEMPFTVSLTAHEGPPDDFIITALGRTQSRTGGG